MSPLDNLPTATGTTGLELLKGVRVLDLTTSIAGPYGTQLLADLGAEVTKVERVGAGDDTRAWGPPFLDGESLWFLSINRNKESLTLDIKQPEGRRIFDQLLASTDVLVVNVVLDVQQRLALDFESLKARYPTLIHVALTGFGSHGARANLPCYDLIAEGYSGVMDLTGEKEYGPQKVGTPAADLLAGQDVALATVAALFERQRTGRGKSIDVSMVASMVRFMAPRVVPYLGSGERVTRSGGRDSVIAIYQVFETADEPITLGLGNDAIWQRFWTAVGKPEYGASASLATNANRRAQRESIVEAIQSLLATRERHYWLALFNENRIPAGPINRVDQVVEDEHLRSEGLFYSVEGVRGKVPQVGLGIRFDGKSEVHRRAPPVLGVDTERVLRERLGMSDVCIAGLKDRQII
ncbi:Crotonobetainyl-CoA:carnitine CoA-transferase CaiB [Caballeronia arationis]|jgi:crotonobetainyl-CoA:carnitine CoA-transferase CaiB-like acyl-CoA transferase|uniref:Crotonobetainyl-CoA:carnitine CoA-transferase CaiB n=1 Tax=Caballeronia arationis TaxID=1777142 RepID=A0A7Z7IFA1_9BURK|nr:CoA transferase [Caballeronia arationis]SOE91423.1 Crotonobetainyl-CoA:carnitine CoA-transferase CaiB [Caballeronia arationis]